MLVAIAANAAVADVPATEVGALDEIVVTAQKREQNLQTVGTSITAFDGATLQKLGSRCTPTMPTLPPWAPSPARSSTYNASKCLADKQYRVYNLDLSVLGFNQGVYGPPRTYGATFNYRWGK